MKRLLVLALAVVCFAIVAEAQMPPFPANWQHVNFGPKQTLDIPPDIAYDPITNTAHILYAQRGSSGAVSIYETWSEGGVEYNELVWASGEWDPFIFGVTTLCISVGSDGRIGVALAGWRIGAWEDGDGLMKLGAVADVIYVERSSNGAWGDQDWKHVFHEAKKTLSFLPWAGVSMEMEYDGIKPVLLIGSWFMTQPLYNLDDELLSYTNTRALLCDPSLANTVGGTPMWYYPDPARDSYSFETNAWAYALDTGSQRPTASGGICQYSFKNLSASGWDPVIASVSLRRNTYESTSTLRRFGVCLGYNSGSNIVFLQRADIENNSFKSCPSAYRKNIQNTSYSGSVSRVGLDYSPQSGIGFANVVYTIQSSSGFTSSLTYYTGSSGTFNQHTLVTNGASILGSVSAYNTTTSSRAMASLLVFDSCEHQWDASVRMYKVMEGLVPSVSLLRTYTDRALDPKAGEELTRFPLPPLMATNYAASEAGPNSRYHIVTCEYPIFPLGQTAPWTLGYYRNIP